MAKSMAKARPVLPEPYSERITDLRSELTRHKLDGYLVQDRMDQYWTTGFTGEDGAVVVTHRAVVLLTDGRFSEAADREAPYARKVLRKMRTPQVNAKEIGKLKLGRLGFNANQMSVGEYKVLKKELSPTRLVETPPLVSRLRAVKNESEVERIRRSIRVAERAFERIRGELRPGMKEREIAARLAYEMQMLGAQGELFPSIVAVGPNGSLPHCEPGDTILTPDQPLLLDWGARVDWYGSDLTRVIWLDSMPPQVREILEVVREAHAAGIEAVRPGARAADVDRVARDVIRKAGYGEQFNHALGHGIGLVAHEPPRLGIGSVDVLQPGMVVTVEPGIYLPGIAGARIEDDVLVTSTGHEVLSTLPAVWS